MRVFAFVRGACAVVAYPMGGTDAQSAGFLASLSRQRALASSMDGGAGEYGRETQSPMVWLNLRKSDLDAKLSGTGGLYEDYASPRLGGYLSA